MSAGIKRTGSRRVVAGSYALVALAVAALLFVGLMAETKSRELAIQAHRAEAVRLLEASRVRMAEVLAGHTEVLSRLAGILQTTPDLADEEFGAVAERLLDQGRADSAMALAAYTDGQLRIHGDASLGGALDRLMAGAEPAVSGARGLVDTAASALAVWMPVAAESGGHAVMLIDTGGLFDAAGLRDPKTGFDVVLVAAPESEADDRRALHLGHSAVLLADPVTTGISLPGGAWTLAAAPRGGWVIPNEAVWPVRVLTLLALGFVALAILRIRTLVRERARNVAQLRHRGTEMRRLSQRLALALDASKVGVWDFNIDTGELIWDAQMAELYAVPVGQLTHSYSDWSQRLHPDDQDRAQAEFADAIRTGGVYRSEYRLILPDGATRHIRAIGQPTRDADGSPKLVGVNWDVSVEIERCTELEARRREAEDGAAAKSQFLATISHELRTPLNGVLGMLDLMLRQPLEAGQRERAEIARRSAEYLLDLLNDVLDLSKLEADGITINAAPVDPVQLAEEVVALLSTVAAERQIELSVFVEGAMPSRVLGDAMRIRQVMFNLVGNAIKFTDTGSVELRLCYEERDGGRLEVVVRDTGIGIGENDRRMLFQRFSQVHHADAQQRGGTGLGLAISKQLVELMGGEISVESVEGLGSTFRFWIRAADCVEASIVAPEAGADAPAVVPARILVAEDNPTNQKILLAYLEIAGHDVELVTDGAEAVARAADERFDLILLDIQMPVMDGLEAARRIRAGGGRSAGAPIIALTASANHGDRERILAAGVTDYLTKPVAMTPLFAVIAAAMDTAGGGGASGILPEPDDGPVASQQ